MGHWMCSEEVREHTGIGLSFWAKRRMTGEPPTYSKIGRLIRYWSDDIDAFMSERMRRSTSEPAPHLSAVSPETTDRPVLRRREKPRHSRRQLAVVGETE